MITLLLAVLSYFSVSLWLPLWGRKTVANYQGRAVPTGLGLVFVLLTAIVLVGRGQEGQNLLFAVLLLFFALLGLIDDCLGDRDKLGLRAHLTAKGVSTGTLKAWGGLAISLAIGFLLASNWFQAAVNALLIALAANFLNSLDLQPGRAGKVYLFLGAVLVFSGPPLLRPLLWLGGAVLGYLWWDLQGHVIMGDTGSNALGAALGLGAVLILPFWGKLAATALLLLLNLAAERVSFSQIIEANSVLRFLDRIGRPS